jgi:hypothetical protein
LAGKKTDAAEFSPVLFGDLARVVVAESNQAVAHWFGIPPGTVSTFRKALGVGKMNAGTTRLRKAYGKEDWFKEAQKKAQKTPWTEKRRRKQSKLFKGKARPKHVIEALRKGRTGKPQSPATRDKITRSHLARKKSHIHAEVALAADFDELVRTLPPAEVARRSGRTLTAVYHRRHRLGINDGCKTNGRLTPTAMKRQTESGNPSRSA